MPERRDAGERDGHNLPASLTTFVGRDAELTQIEALLSTHRLITIVGPGGCGKTRLSIELGRRLLTRFPDGVWMVDLAPVDDAGLAAQAVAVVLGIREYPDLSIVDSIAKVAGRRNLLVIMDNCEHVLDAAAEVCDRLLRAGSDARILATSREPLGLAGELARRLPPLALPARAATEDVEPCSSVALFCDRALLADADFVLDDASRPAVETLVRSLDGMPLAIELATAQLDVLTLRQLVEDLGGGGSHLVSRVRGVADRHRSLAATIAWSFRSLSPVEARAFTRLSVFPAPFTAAAATALLGADSWELLGTLARRSLLVAPRPGPDGQDRYQMLETLRSFAAAALDEFGDRDETMRAWVNWLVLEACRAAAGFDTADELPALAWVDAERENLLDAIEWALVNNPDAALDLGLAMAAWWLLRGHLAEGRNRLRRALDAGSAAPPERRAAALLWLARLAHDGGDFTAVLDLATAAESVLRGSVDVPLSIDVINSRAMPLLDLGNAAEARRLSELALVRAQAIEYASGYVDACTSLTYIGLSTGAFEEALANARVAEAVEASGVAGRILRSSRTALGDALAVSGRLDEAERYFRATLDRCRHIGDRALAAMQLEGLARVAMRSDNGAAARDQLREAIGIAGEIGDRLRVADCLSDLAVWLMPDRPEEAATMWGAGQAIFTSIGMPRLSIAEISDQACPSSAYDSAFLTETVLQIRDTLDPGVAARAEQRGRELSLDDAIDRALRLLDDNVSSAPPRDAPSGLTPRERELVHLVADGLTDQEIADRLFISVRTVRSHLDRVRDKTGARRRADLTRLALTLDG